MYGKVNCNGINQNIIRSDLRIPKLLDICNFYFLLIFAFWMFFNGHVLLNRRGGVRWMSVYRAVYTRLKKYLASWDAQFLPRVGKNKEAFADLPCHGEVSLPEQSQKKPPLPVTAVSWSIPAADRKPGRKSGGGRKRVRNYSTKLFLLQAWRHQEFSPLCLSLSSCLRFSLFLLFHSFLHLSSQLVFIECPENWGRSQKTSLSSRHLLFSG